MDFKGYRIAGARIHAEMTMKEAAKRLGISKSTLLSWEHDESKIPVYAIGAIADLYSVPRESLACFYCAPKVHKE